MRKVAYFLLSFLFILQGCNSTGDFSQVLEDIQENLDFGNLASVIQVSDSLKKLRIKDPEVLHVADSLEQIAQRIYLEFPVSDRDEMNQLKKRLETVTSEDVRNWEQKGWLEYKIIDGDKKYFKRAASNLVLLKNFHEQKEKTFLESSKQPDLMFRLNHTQKVLDEAGENSKPVVPVRMRVTYTITLQKNTVPDGERIRCWMPWPRSDNARQHDIRLLSCSNQNYVISPDTAIHSTIYLEEISHKDSAAKFSVSYEYISEAQHFDMDRIRSKPYDKGSVLYRKYTAEQLPNICFSENVRHLADSITGNETDPVKVVRNIWLWFKENIPWAGALEYSVMPNIPEYVCLNRRGDCGMQTFLFISMLRYKGIPVKWQSGWMMPPVYENLHDWSEVYFEGTGWVPVDASYDLQNSENPNLRYYFLSGIDAYRLIVNEGVSGPLHPEKQFMRSEPYDFQRGELEWKGGNIYFDKWDYDMKIEYLP